MGEPFISVAELAAFLNPRAPRDLSADVLAPIMVAGACDAIRTLTGQDLDYQEDAVVTFSGDGENGDLILPQGPVLEVSEVQVDGEVDLDWNLTSGGVLRRTVDYASGGLPRRYWPRGNANIQVTYTRGWEEIPDDLRLLALVLAGRGYEQGLARQESTGSASVTYSVPAAQDLSAGEKAIVAKYTRRKYHPTVAAPA